jgi:hypothetical protein
VSRNEAGTDGGGIFTDFSALTASRSTIAGNDALDDGGGVFYTANSTFNLTNSTVSGNSANDDGGGIDTNEGTTNLRNATVNRNVAGSGGGVVRTAGSLAINLRNSILAGNFDVSPGASDCSGTLNSDGYNLFGALTGCTIGGVTTGNLTNPDPGLALLSANGGATLTHALLAGSPALNAGYPGSGAGQPCETIDQRSLPRGGGAGLCDIGAFEVQPTPPSNPATPSTPAPAPSGGGTVKKKCKKAKKRAAASKKKCKKKKRK